MLPPDIKKTYKCWDCGDDLPANGKGWGTCRLCGETPDDLQQERDEEE